MNLVLLILKVTSRRTDMWKDKKTNMTLLGKTDDDALNCPHSKMLGEQCSELQ